MYEPNLADNGRVTNAIHKARRIRPLVTRLSADSYNVEGEGDEYFVRFFLSDGVEFVHCTCDAGTYNNPCYHVAAVTFQRDKDATFENNAYVRETSESFGHVFELAPGRQLPAFANAVTVTVVEKV